MHVKISDHTIENNSIAKSTATDYVVFDPNTGEDIGSFGILLEEYHSTKFSSITISFFEVFSQFIGLGFAKEIAKHINNIISKLNALCLLVEPCPYKDNGLSADILKIVYAKYFSVVEVFGSKNFLVKSLNHKYSADESFELIISSEFSSLAD